MVVGFFIHYENLISCTIVSEIIKYPIVFNVISQLASSSGIRL